MRHDFLNNRVYLLVSEQITFGPFFMFFLIALCFMDLFAFGLMFLFFFFWLYIIKHIIYCSFKYWTLFYKLKDDVFLG